MLETGHFRFRRCSYPVGPGTRMGWPKEVRATIPTPAHRLPLLRDMMCPTAYGHALGLIALFALLPSALFNCASICTCTPVWNPAAEGRARSPNEADNAEEGVERAKKEGGQGFPHIGGVFYRLATFVFRWLQQRQQQQWRANQCPFAGGSRSKWWMGSRPNRRATATPQCRQPFPVGVSGVARHRMLVTSVGNGTSSSPHCCCC